MFCEDTPSILGAVEAFGPCNLSLTVPAENKRSRNDAKALKFEEQNNFHASAT